MPTASVDRYFEDPHRWLNRVQRRYLSPLNLTQRAMRRCGFAVNRLATRCLLCYRVEGREHVPSQPPVIFAPSHTSSLDPFVLAAALPYHVFQNCRWAARARSILGNWFLRLANRIGGSVPIWGGKTALAAGASILEQGRNLIWFPEGRRTRDGQLQPLRPGIGHLATHFHVQVIPVRIIGAYRAMPPGKYLPRLRETVAVRFGPPLSSREGEQAEQFVERLQEALASLGD